MRRHKTCDTSTLRQIQTKEIVTTTPKIRILNMARKIFKWACITLTGLVLLPLLLMTALYIPPIQNWAVQKACGYASETTGMDISLERVKLTFLLDLELENLTAIQAPDTLLHTDAVVVDLDFRQALDGKIGVESIIIRNGLFNSLDMIPQVHIDGRLGLLELGREDTDLGAGIAQLSNARIEDCDLDIRLRDTTIVDTTESSPVPWSILVDDIGIRNSRIRFGTAGDTLSVNTGIRQARLKKGDINLASGTYRAGSLGLTVDSLLLCMKDSTGTTIGIPLPATTLSVDSFLMDTVGLDLKRFELYTGEPDSIRSSIRGAAGMDFTAFTPGQGGHFHAKADLSLSHADVLDIARDFIPDDLAKAYPALPLEAGLTAEGNIDSLQLPRLDIGMPTAFDINAQGALHNIMDSGMRQGDVTLEARTMNLDFVRRYLGLSGMRLPGMKLSADAHFKGNSYQAAAQLQRGPGSVRMTAKADLDNMAYNASLAVKDWDMGDFMPQDSIGRLSLTAELRGHGTDIYSRATGLRGRVSLDKLEYKHWNVDNVSLGFLLRQGRASVDMLCENDLLEANACAAVDISKKNSMADFSLALNRIDFYALGMTRDTLTASMTLALNGNTDMRHNHSIRGSIHSMELATSDSAYYPLDLELDAAMNDTCMYAVASSGDLELDFRADESLDSMTYKAGKLMQEMQSQMARSRIAPDTLRGMLPHMKMRLACRKENPLASFLRSMAGATFNDLSFELRANPSEGVNGRGHLNKLYTSAVRIDSISWYIRQDADDINMLARVKNGPRNKMVNFESIFTASVSPGMLKSHLLFLDAQGRKGIDLGMMANATDSCTWLHLFPHNPILAYRTFIVNDSNYVAVDQARRIKADLHLLADDGTSLRLYSTPNEAAEQDVTLSIGKFNLGELSSVLPFMPMVTGMLDGDVHALQEGDQYTFSIDMDVRRMGFEGSPLGDIGMNMIYFPNADGSHLMDGILSQNGREIVQLSGKYTASDKEAQVEAEALLKRLPLNMANGFVPDNILRLEGYISGPLGIRGPVSAPLMSGTLATDSVHICSDPYSIDLRIPDDSIAIRDSYLDLDKIQAYANGSNPLTLDGTVDFTDLERTKLNLSIVARDFNLINAPKRKGAEAYGKVYADIFGRMRGTLDNLDIRGRMKISGRTNVTYVMKDSPLTVDDQLSSMVTFTDFADTLEAEQTVRLPEQNIRMDLQVNIDEATTIHCLMSEDGQDKIDLEGGGELRMTYDMLNGMRLFGRYTILSGRMDYSLVVVALKNFQINSGSYVEFAGDMLNPKLNLSASERKKASVTTNNVTRSVSFDVGLRITQTLSDLGLEFTLEAPEDLSVRNELSAMSTEDRGRAAVAMLTTGIYLSPNGGDGTSGFDATNALNSFLNSQISNIAGKALSTIDIGFGIDNSTSATGASQTDYNFSFAKRFWGNRISIIIGGKVSSGNEAKNTGMSILNNVSIEYRLDNSGTRYVKAFYNKDTESLLDAEVMEMGASLVLRKKTENLGELFIFRDTRKKRQAQAQRKAAGTTAPAVAGQEGKAGRN